MLNGKTAVVTGGGSGIGKATALKLAADGANIVIVHMDPEEKAAEVVSEIEAKGVKAKAIRMDVSDFEAVSGMSCFASAARRCVSMRTPPFSWVRSMVLRAVAS